MGKLMSIYELAENLSLVFTKLDTELGLAQPQLVIIIIFLYSFFLYLFIFIKEMSEGSHFEVI